MDHIHKLAIRSGAELTFDIGGYILLDPLRLPEPDDIEGDLKVYRDRLRDRQLTLESYYLEGCDVDRELLCDQWNRDERKPRRGQLFYIYTDFMRSRRRQRRPGRKRKSQKRAA